MAHRRFKGLKPGALGRFIPCVLISLGVTLLSTLIMAALAASSENPSAKIGLYSLVALLLSAAVSGFISARISPDTGIKYPFLTSLATVLIMLLLSVIMGSSPSGASFMNYGCFMLVCVFVGLVSRKRDKRRKRR